MHIIVLDTSAFIAGYDPFSSKERGIIVSKVQEEIKINSIVSIRLELAIENGIIEVKIPLEEYKMKTIEIANMLGDSHVLSQTDLDLLAIALELKSEGLKPKIVTDDYSMQNVANQMKIDFIPLATMGINHLLKWIRYCPACFKKYSNNYKSKICSICGTKLKRKPERKNRVRKTIKEKREKQSKIDLQIRK